ncbi:hypothetical protein BX600DRAFT_285542 [Xylariales sp. PMI_506]|nr:hypothetical protein BX600DRAFT_285542 [Xylariales sp. PMI_506]
MPRFRQRHRRGLQLDAITGQAREGTPDDSLAGRIKLEIMDDTTASFNAACQAGAQRPTLHMTKDTISPQDPPSRRKGNANASPQYVWPEKFDEKSSGVKDGLIASLSSQMEQTKISTNVKQPPHLTKRTGISGSTKTVTASPPVISNPDDPRPVRSIDLCTRTYTKPPSPLPKRTHSKAPPLPLRADPLDMAYLQKKVSFPKFERLGSSKYRSCIGNEDNKDSSWIERAQSKRETLRILMPIVYSIYNDTQAPCEPQDGGSNYSGSSTGSSATQSPLQGQNGGHSGYLGKRTQLSSDNIDNEGEDDELQPSKRPKKGIRDSSHLGRKRLACPYYQRKCHHRLPITTLPSRSCHGPGFGSVHRVKEHLYRAHLLPLECPRCDVTFESDTLRLIHMRQDPSCIVLPKRTKEGIDVTTEKILRSRNKEFNSKTEEEKWKAVYELLFPADNPEDLPSPYYEDYSTSRVEVESPQSSQTPEPYQEFVGRELFQRVYQVLEQKIDESVDSAEKEVASKLKSELHTIINDVKAELTAEFHRNSEKSTALTVAYVQPEPPGVVEPSAFYYSSDWPYPAFQGLDPAWLGNAMDVPLLPGYPELTPFDAIESAHVL